MCRTYYLLYELSIRLDEVQEPVLTRFHHFVPNVNVSLIVFILVEAIVRMTLWQTRKNVCIKIPEDI